MSESQDEVRRAVHALQECIQPVLEVLHSDRELSRRDHILIHEAISKLEVALHYWETKRPA